MMDVPATSEADISMSSANVKLLSSAILNITKMRDKLEETPSSKGKDGGKRWSQESQNDTPVKKPAKDCSCSTCEQNTSDNEDL